MGSRHLSASAVSVSLGGWAFLALTGACAHPSRATTSTEPDAPIPCLKDEPRRKSRSEELQAIVKADQEERKDWQSLSEDQLAAMARRDQSRRKRVGEIFGEGCFSLAEDYAAAGLVFQHGDTPDHYYQTFVWSQRGVELGDPGQKSLMALGLDRFLVNTGRKQLFGTQAKQAELGQCFCLEPVEKSFPERLRREYAGRTVAQSLKWVNGLNSGKACPPAKECAASLKPVPKGSVPGFW